MACQVHPRVCKLLKALAETFKGPLLGKDPRFPLSEPHLQGKVETATRLWRIMEEVRTWGEEGLDLPGGVLDCLLLLVGRLQPADLSRHLHLWEWVCRVPTRACKGP